MIEAGRRAPDFCLSSSDKEQVCLRELLGQWVVLYFYPKDNTSGLKKGALEFSELTPQFQSSGAVVYGISPDSPESHKKFIEKHYLKVPLLSDPAREVLKAYGAWGKKQMYGKEHEGVIRSTVAIDPEGVVRLTWPGVQSKGHAAQVLHSLKELLG
jgi:peroxiredoxin Q/BCP